MERRANLLGGSGAGAEPSRAIPFFRQCPPLVFSFSKIAVGLYPSLIANVGTWYRLQSAMSIPERHIYICAEQNIWTWHILTGIISPLNRE